MFPYLSYFPQCCVFVYSSLLSFQISHALPLCVLRLVDCLPVLIIVTCPVMIVDTCSSSPCVYSLCVPVVSLPVRLSHFHVSRVPAIFSSIWFPSVADLCLSNKPCFCLLPVKLVCLISWLIIRYQTLSSPSPCRNCLPVLLTESESCY